MSYLGVRGGGDRVWIIGKSRFSEMAEDKNVTIVINWPAGVSIDLVGRMIADGLTKKISQNVVYR